MGLLTLGLSGALSEAFGRIFGAGFVAGDPSGVTYTPARCDDYFEYFPTAGSCGEAAALHHWGEVVEGRVLAGILGLLALLGFLFARRFILRGPSWAPPVPFVVTVLLAALAGIAILLGGVSVMAIAFGQTSGTGGQPRRRGRGRAGRRWARSGGLCATCGAVPDGPAVE